MAKKNTTSTNTNPAVPNATAATSKPRRGSAKKSAAETVTAASGESAGRHRRASPAKQPVQPEVAAVAVPVEEVPVAAFTEHPVAIQEQASSPAPTSISITQEDIARLAFSYFEQRGYQGGSQEEDWLRAEEELLQLV